MGIHLLLLQKTLVNQRPIQKKIKQREKQKYLMFLMFLKMANIQILMTKELFSKKIIQGGIQIALTDIYHLFFLSSMVKKLYPLKQKGGKLSFQICCQHMIICLRIKKIFQNHYTKFTLTMTLEDQNLAFQNLLIKRNQTFHLSLILS